MIVVMIMMMKWQYKQNSFVKEKFISTSVHEFCNFVFKNQGKVILSQFLGKVTPF